MEKNTTQQDKQIPQSLNACTKMDGTVQEIYRWVEWIETIRKKYWKYVGIGAGVITFLWLVIASSNDLVDDTFGMFMVGLVVVGIAAVSIYITIYIVEKVTSLLASIGYNTAISTNVALYESEKKNVVQ